MKKCVVLLLWCYLSYVNLELIPHESQHYFEVINKVSTTDLHHATTEEASYTFRAQLKVNSVWNSDKEQLLQVYLLNPTVSAAARKSASKPVVQEITAIPDRPFYISLVNGKPQAVIAHTSRDQSLLNLERGIASLLQIRYENGPISEIDVSGQCTAFYSIKSSTRIEKRKTECSHWDLRVNYRSEKPLSVTQNSQQLTHFDLNAEGGLVRAESVETHQIMLEANQKFGTEVRSLFSIEHLRVGDEAVEQLPYESLKSSVDSLLEWYRVFDIEADVDGAISEIKDATLTQLISAYAKQLEDAHIGTEDLASAFAKLIPLTRITKQPELVEILKNHKNLHSQLVDLLGGAQTIDAHNALHEVFNFKADVDLYEKYLQSLAVGTHPERAIIEDLFKRVINNENPIQNEKQLDSIIQTICSLVSHSNLDPNDNLLQKVRSHVLDHLTNCEDVVCQTLYIRALQNLQDPSTIPTLMTYVSNEDVKVSSAAMQALKSFPIANYRENHRQFFAQIFYQVTRKFDSSVRTMALDILLDMKPTKNQLEDFIKYLSSNDRHYEVKTYVIQKLQMLSERCPRFRSLLNSCLSEHPSVNNYNVIAQKGLSTVLMRRLSTTPAFNESLLSVQEISQGVLKRGTVDLIVSAERSDVSIFKIGIFTSGLTSFVGDGDTDELDENESDDSPASAGMEISVQGVLLRPLIFFTGQTELMGHVWSGTASDITPAYQATTVTQDHEHYIMLSSGATVFISVIGANSIDLNGKVELSIWNRNANTEINQLSGIGIIGTVVAGFTYGRIKNEFQIKYEPKLSLIADLDFYSGIKLCMQLERPKLNLKYESKKMVTLNKYSKSVVSNSSFHIPGSTLALNQKNNEMCNLIHQ